MLWINTKKSKNEGLWSGSCNRGAHDPAACTEHMAIPATQQIGERSGDDEINKLCLCIPVTTKLAVRNHNAKSVAVVQQAVVPLRACNACTASPTSGRRIS